MAEQGAAGTPQLTAEGGGVGTYDDRLQLCP